MPSLNKRLFTPGPLNTSHSVKQAMMADFGSRDEQFIERVAEIRDRILRVAGVSQELGFEAIPMQGSGTFGIEAILSTVIAPNDRILILVNGAYGHRIAEIADCLSLNYDVMECKESATHDLNTVDSVLGRSRFTHLASVHCETTTGILNPVEELGSIAVRRGCRYIVDAMSSFGGIPFDVRESHVDFLVSSSNKCLQGVPGFAFVIARRDALLQLRHRPRSVSLNLRAQLDGLEVNGQFRFTPPTHAMLAFHQALNELEQEGGVARRAARYRANQRVLVEGMRVLGFKEYVPRDLQSAIITSFLYPEDPRFDFPEFYQRLSEKGMLIYPGKVSDAGCFRIGSIGDLVPEDMIELVNAIAQTVADMQLTLPTIASSSEASGQADVAATHVG